MLFDPIRDSVKNITEIGLAQGQSLQASRKYVGAERGSAAWHSQSAPLVAQVWHDYFENAQIWGVDIHMGVIKHARKLFRDQPRVPPTAEVKNPECRWPRPHAGDDGYRAPRQLAWTEPRHSAAACSSSDSFSVRRLLRAAESSTTPVPPLLAGRHDGDHFLR